MRTPLALSAVALLLWSSPGASQDSHPAREIISIGNYPRVDGLRINFRDRDLERVRGVNLTVWSPVDPATGKVAGWALGVPVTGAGSISGLATGVLGIGASHRISGVALGAIGVGSGDRISGIAIGGVGVGSGGRLDGIIVGGIGAGTGSSMEGLIVGGVGVGGGGTVRGVALGGVGVGSGGGISGLAIAGVGVGSGGTIRGVALSGIGVGAPRLIGGFAALAVGGQRVHGVVVAPALMRVERDGSFTGGSISSVNYIRGSQTGLTIGLFNYARSLKGLQLGLINIVADSRSHSILPLINWGSGRE